MKKKILFMLENMNVGGTEKALLNMISEIPKENYEITVLMLEEYGGFLDFLPGEVHVEYLKGYKNLKSILNEPPRLTMVNYIKNGNLVKALLIAFLHLISKVMKDRRMFFRYVLKSYPVNKTKYDIAVAFEGPMELITYFVLNKLKAERRVQWIHLDVTKTGFSRTFASKTYKKFDKIFVVSDEGRNNLTNLLPDLTHKIDTFSNIISEGLISGKASEHKGFDDNFEGLRLLTVGRLSMEKGQDLAINVLARLIDNGYNVKWYCIGEGSSRQKYQQLIERLNLTDKFILLGAKTNPYPYMEQCDIYVQPSRHEGYCISLAEARCLNKPIVTTDFVGAKEQIKNEETGLIVGVNENEIYDAVAKLINSKELRNKFSRNLANEFVDTKVEIGKLYSLLELNNKELKTVIAR